MRVLVTKVDFIHSPTKGDFVKMNYIDDTGDTGFVFTTKTQYDSWDFDSTKVCNQQDLAVIMNKFQTCNVEYGARGRVLKVE